MFSEIGFFIIAAVYFAHAIYLRVCYFKHEAVCLELQPLYKSPMVGVLYEYELEQPGKMVTYQNWGRAYLNPRKGKRYRILICKTDYDKVSGYQVYVVHLFMGALCLAVQLFLLSL